MTCIVEVGRGHNPPTALNSYSPNSCAVLKCVLATSRRMPGPCFATSSRAALFTCAETPRCNVTPCLRPFRSSQLMNRSRAMMEAAATAGPAGPCGSSAPHPTARVRVLGVRSRGRGVGEGGRGCAAAGARGRRGRACVVRERADSGRGEGGGGRPRDEGGGGAVRAARPGPAKDGALAAHACAFAHVCCCRGYDSIRRGVLFCLLWCVWLCVVI